MDRVAWQALFFADSWARLSDRRYYFHQDRRRCKGTEKIRDEQCQAKGASVIEAPSAQFGKSQRERGQGLETSTQRPRCEHGGWKRLSCRRDTRSSGGRAKGAGVFIDAKECGACDPEAATTFLYRCVCVLITAGHNHPSRHRLYVRLEEGTWVQGHMTGSRGLVTAGVLAGLHCQTVLCNSVRRGRDGERQRVRGRLPTEGCSRME